MKIDLIKGLITVAIAGFISYFSKLAVPVLVLLFFMIADYVTGICGAWVQNELNSRVGVIGIIKKVCYLVTICVAMGADYLVFTALGEIGLEYSLTYTFGMIVTIWLIINELISILENIAKISGESAPPILSSLLKKLKNTVEQTGSDEE